MGFIAMPQRHQVLALSALHIAIIIASNYLVQLPVDIFGLHSTWGAFSFPLIFLATDLTVRLLGKQVARRIIAHVMLPALVASYVVGALFQEGRFAGWGSLLQFNSFVFRIALASFAAYALGQLLDVQVFDRIRQRARRWWLAPAGSAVLGEALDTAVFFSVAFWHSSNPFMAANWMEIGAVDYAIKLGASLVFFVPAYGMLLSALMRRLGRDRGQLAAAAR
ncbi:MAG: 7-cyano-7-deazaguanine/7-aminomethyl-7-deazaguanine transporter [Ottowia sp.]|nr:7-cyano-7-deazaguanine/7-aminomethyl-7-deazaguanine transporter [Ottowia sp.]